PSSPLFPYTTLFRSASNRAAAREGTGRRRGVSGEVVGSRLVGSIGDIALHVSPFTTKGYRVASDDARSDIVQHPGWASGSAISVVGYLGKSVAKRKRR